jgi:AraC family transcriptional regulator of adaptative response / DNA-3-methyladenine glycosylase II
MTKKKIIGVKTTRIYCRPSCPAKAPLPENTVHFKTAAQAERNGYRACQTVFSGFSGREMG